jgi:16S rRNA processing protein RimM
MLNNNYIPMGKIIGAFGIKGWLKLRTSISDSSSIKNYNHFYVKIDDNEYTCLTIEAISIKHDLLQIKFLGIDDRTVAETYRNYNIYVLRNELPTTNQDEFYWADLLNMKVINQDNIVLGSVTSLLETGSTSVLVIKGENDYMVPFVSIYIETVDLADKIIKVFWELDY